MAKFQKFEDIVTWQKARQLVAEIYKLTNDTTFSKDFALRDQIRRAAISVTLNIAEGFARRGDRQFRHFLHIAQGSTAETQAALYIALDQQYLSEESFDRIYNQCEEISKMLSGLIKYLT